MLRPFRFGVASVETASGSAWTEFARRAEALGYATLLVPDHYLNPLTPVPALMAAAAVTTTLRVGCTVFANDFRHPALLAKEAATIDLLSGGRFEFGLGAGWLKDEYDQVGIPFDPPGVRVARMEEGLRVIKGLWGEEPVTFAGAYYTISGLEGTPKPVQRPHPPIYVGGGGKRLLSCGRAGGGHRRLRVAGASRGWDRLDRRDRGGAGAQGRLGPGGGRGPLRPAGVGPPLPRIGRDRSAAGGRRRAGAGVRPDRGAGAGVLGVCPRQRRPDRRATAGAARAARHLLPDRGPAADGGVRPGRGTPRGEGKGRRASDAHCWTGLICRNGAGSVAND